MTDVETLILADIKTIRESTKEILGAIDKLRDSVVTKEACGNNRSLCVATTREDISLKKLVVVAGIVTTVASTVATVVAKMA